MKNKISQIRKEKKITQASLAKALKISRPYLSELENGKYNPSGTLMFKVARYFDMKAEDIFFDDTVMQEEQQVSS